MVAPRILTLAEVRRQLEELDGWRFFGAAIHASYDAPDFPSAIRLVGEIADAAQTMNHHPDIDIRWRTVVLTCSTHSAGGVTQFDIELAHQIQQRAREAQADPGAPPPRQWELALDAVDIDLVRDFWAVALDYDPGTQPDGTIELFDPTGRQPNLWFQPMDPPRDGRDRFHVDVYREAGEAETLRDRLLELGGSLEDDSHAPDWWVVADPEGNLCCVCTA